MTDKLTAAEEYAEIKRARFEKFLEDSFSAENLKGVDLYEVKCPSGMTFKCRRATEQLAAAAGQLPMALSSQFIGSQSGQKLTPEEEEKQWNAMPVAEREASLLATGRIVRFIAVSPRIVLELNGHRDAILGDALTIDDFKYLANWAKGGDAAEGLKTFRRKRK